jgi:hypothetical protein
MKKFLSREKNEEKIQKKLNFNHIISRSIIFILLNIVVEIFMWKRISFDFQLKTNLVVLFTWIFLIELIFSFKRLYKLHPFNYWSAFLTPLIANILFNLFIFKNINIFSVSSVMSVLIITMLIDYESGILSSLIFGIYFGIIYGFDIRYMFIIFVPGIITALIARNIKRRIEILLPFFVSTAIQAFLTITFVVGNDFDLILPLIISNFFSVIFAMGILPFFEYATRVYSDIGLLELGNLNHPLIKKLSLKAPGTYYHSMIIANLAESAVEYVGGNHVLVRVGAYFHDIGKIWKPTFFTENQKTENPHTNISPKLSSLILNNHVSYGKEIAEKNRLPILIEDMIMQHQGTRVKQFFYKKYYDQTGIQDVDMFKYPGPIPQFKESAILMICDVTEAITRSITDLTPNTLNEKLDELIQSLFMEGQFDDCGLKLKEIQKIKGRIIRTVMEMNHKRIAYPKIAKKELKG